MFRSVLRPSSDILVQKPNKARYSKDLMGPLLYSNYFYNFDVLLTVHLSIFISGFNQIDAQNLFHNKCYFMPLHVSSTCAHHQEVKIALHSYLVYETATYMCDDTRGCVMQF